MRILTETVTSPTLGAQIKKLLAQFPEAKWHQYEPSGGDSVREGTRLAFGKPVNPVYHFEQARRDRVARRGFPDQRVRVIRVTRAIFRRDAIWPRGRHRS